MNLKRTWGYILMGLLLVHLSCQDTQPNMKKMKKDISDLLDDKLTDFLENKMEVFLEERLTEIVGEKMEQYVTDRFDRLEDKLEKVSAICNNNNNNCTSGDCDSGLWSSWSDWGDCSATCGGGRRQRYRTCGEALSNVEQTCPGSSTETQNCNNHTCPRKECPVSEYQTFVAPGGSQCFKWFGQPDRTFEDAVAWCESQGMRLAEPDDDVVVALRKYMSDRIFSGSVESWVGSKRLADTNEFRWLSTNNLALPNDSPLWWSHNPDVSNYQDTCMLMTTHSYWMEEYPTTPYVDYPCDYQRYTLCELV